MHTKIFHAAQGILLCKNEVINRVLKWFVCLIDLKQHTAGGLILHGLRLFTYYIWYYFGKMIIIC